MMTKLSFDTIFLAHMVIMVQKAEVFISHQYSYVAFLCSGLVIDKTKNKALSLICVGRIGWS